jgi:hypothetical protein
MGEYYAIFVLAKRQSTGYSLLAGVTSTPGKTQGERYHERAAKWLEKVCFECGAIVAGVEFAAGVACTVESVGRSAEQRSRTTSAGVLAKRNMDS